MGDVPSRQSSLGTEWEPTGSAWIPRSSQSPPRLSFPWPVLAWPLQTYEFAVWPLTPWNFLPSQGTGDYSRMEPAQTHWVGELDWEHSPQGKAHPMSSKGSRKGVGGTKDAGQDLWKVSLEYHVFWLQSCHLTPPFSPTSRVSLHPGVPQSLTLLGPDHKISTEGHSNRPPPSSTSAAQPAQHCCGVSTSRPLYLKHGASKVIMDLPKVTHIWSYNQGLLISPACPEEQTMSWWNWPSSDNENHESWVQSRWVSHGGGGCTGHAGKRQIPRRASSWKARALLLMSKGEGSWWRPDVWGPGGVRQHGKKAPVLRQDHKEVTGGTLGAPGLPSSCCDSDPSSSALSSLSISFLPSPVAWPLSCLLLHILCFHPIQSQLRQISFLKWWLSVSPLRDTKVTASKLKKILKLKNKTK